MFLFDVKVNLSHHTRGQRELLEHSGEGEYQPISTSQPKLFFILQKDRYTLKSSTFSDVRTHKKSIEKKKKRHHTKREMDNTKFPIHDYEHNINFDCHHLAILYVRIQINNFRIDQVLFSILGFCYYFIIFTCPFLFFTFSFLISNVLFHFQQV